MDPRDLASDLLDGAECGACGRPVPPHRVRVLASRDDLAFAELPCAACGSTSLAIFVGTGETAGTAGTATTAPAPEPISTDDVLDMHRFLASWSGDLRGLVERGDASSHGPREA
jgi:hypothetical protein